LPPFLVTLRERVAAHLGLAAAQFVHVLVSEYRPGTPIGWHRDKPQYGIVVGISLAGVGRMRWRPYAHQDAQHTVSLDLGATLDVRDARAHPLAVAAQHAAHARAALLDHDAHAVDSRGARVLNAYMASRAGRGRRR
jgi:hypothetical protein